PVAVAHATVSISIQTLRTHICPLALHDALPISLVSLQTIDAGVQNVLVQAAPAPGASYCVESTVGTKSWHKSGPGAPLATGKCPERKSARMDCSRASNSYPVFFLKRQTRHAPAS